jgi:seryl-tRNA synthetase
MHDLNFFRDHLDLFAEAARKRNSTLDLDAFRVLDKERRELITENEQRKAQRTRPAMRSRGSKKKNRVQML